MIRAVAADLGLSSHSKKYIELIVSKERIQAKGDPVPKDIEQQIKKILPLDYEVVRDEKIKMISHWYYLPIRQLAKGDCLPFEPKEIAKILRGKVTVEEVEFAIEDMHSMGILVVDKKNKKITTTTKSFKINKQVPTRVIQDYHRAMLDLASHAILEQSILDRSTRALTFKIEESAVPEIKSRIYEFVDSINKEFYQENSKNVYQLNLQLFSLTKN